MTDIDPAAASIIAAAEILAGSEEEYEHPADRRAVFTSQLRHIAGSVRNTRNLRTVDSILSEDTSAFASVVRGIGFHDGSQRYQIQLEDPEDADGEIEYISTARVDNDKVAVEQLVAELDDARDKRVLVYKHMEQGKDGRKFRSLVHFQVIGGEVGSCHDDLDEQLDDHIAQIGKKKGS